MAGPGDGRAARSRGHLRASLADREQVIGVIKAAFAQGRLAKDEYDQRVGLALAPRTYAELAALTADLPPGRPSMPARVPCDPTGHPARMMAVATALYGGAWVYALLASPTHGIEGPAATLLILGSLFAYISALLIGVMTIVVRRRSQRG